jgi:ATP-dependent helicase/DNAse subunit B
MPDKFSAVWVSHSSLCDFLKCPRSYYLKNVYKDPRTRNKIQITSPALALGSAVHEVLESLSVLPTSERFTEPLLAKFHRAWQKVSGEKGGFSSAEQEAKYRARGEMMMERVNANKGPLSKLAVKIKQELPYFWLSEADNIILCGKIDWLEYDPETDSVNIIDFKTSKNEEDGNSLQLPIYYLLTVKCQHHKVAKASYWYLEFSDELKEKVLPQYDDSYQQVMTVAKQVKLARQLNMMKCSNPDGCQYCKPFERVLDGEGKLVNQNQGRDIYMLSFGGDEAMQESEIL